jgi:hypothetical protein
MSERDRSGRRSFISRVGVAAGAVAALTPSTALARLGDRAQIGALGLVPQQNIGGWTIVAIHRVRFGAVPVVLEDARGERFQVDILRRDSRPDTPDGIGNTDTFSVYLSNRGDGGKATREEHGLGALALAKALGDGEVEVPDDLLTFAERRARHPGEAYSVPLVRARTR